ncbi:MAG: helix-turn-helix domain-containing protein [Gammaproteobacteria bacterium]
MANRPWDQRQVAFRRAIREARAGARLTQVALSAKLAKPQSYVSKYESGDRRLDYLETREICACCGITIAAFDRLLVRAARRKIL